MEALLYFIKSINLLLILVCGVEKWTYSLRKAFRSYIVENCSTRLYDMDALYGHATEPIPHRVSRAGRPNVVRELAGARLERLRSKKKARAGFASNVTVKIREITELLTDDRNLSTVKEKLVHAVIAFDRLKEAHFDYWSEVKDASGIAECRDYWVKQNENFGAFRQQVDDWMALAEHKVLLASLRGGSDLLISPEDSVSCIGSQAQSSSSKRSKNHSRASTRGSLAAPVEAVRMKEAAKFAELKAEKVMLERRQVLEEKKFRLKQEEARLNLEVEIAKSAAKEHALAALSPSPSDNLPLRPLESKPEVKKEDVGAPVIRELNYSECSGESHYVPPRANARRQDIMQDNTVFAADPDRFIACDDYQKEALAFQRQQTALQVQQNRIVELLAVNQNKSRLPQPRVPMFDGNPVEYRSFIQAFENLIESRTQSSTERLYYLEQYTSGDVKELVRSCHHLPPEEGYVEARRLLLRKFGDEYRIASAYESKALAWPQVKPEDGFALSKFAIFLSSCKNALSSSLYASKFDQPGNLQKLVFKLPFSMRERWRRSANDIMELQSRPVKFDDLVAFVDREARIATNPVFGNISSFAQSGSGSARRPSQSHAGSASSKVKTSTFATQVQNNRHANPEQYSDANPVVLGSQSVTCPFCQKSHALEDCRFLRWKPYQERIKFLSSMRLCFGCLSDNHVARLCPQRKVCKIPNCSRKHPTVLHTTSVREKSSVDIGVGTESIADTQVSNAMASTVQHANTLHGDTCGRIAMAVVPVKVHSRKTNRTVVTLAFLDSGSTATFCTESLMKKLDERGPEIKISLSTLEKKNSLVDSYLLRDITVSDLDENDFINLSTLYTRPEIPVNGEDIPTQEDVDRWPHLNGVFIPHVDTEIGLLIASDVPEALDPIEVKHSQNGGPYAARTRIGWAINGPLGRRRNRSQSKSTSFLVRVDPQFQRMVEDFYNRDFTDCFPTEVINTVFRNFYVDDCLKSFPAENDAIAHVNHLQALLSRGGFRLTKWVSNSRKVLQAIPKPELSKELRRLDLSKDEIPAQRALGMQWCVETDTFTFNIGIKPRQPTRRGILSIVSSVFDPLGFAAPFVLFAKQILQDLCRIKLGWDDEIPPEHLSSWVKWLDDLPKLSSFSVNRSVLPERFGPVVFSQLHHFSDASEAAYGSVSYLRITNAEGRVHGAFLFAKSRLAPLKSTSIPRLELSAATISIRLDKMLKREIEIPLSEPSIFWTDSMSVLRYVKNENKRFHTFVANRIAMIRDSSSPCQWYHLEGIKNPGDHTSRGLSAEGLLSCEKWLMGPEFLWKSECQWPTQSLDTSIVIQHNDPEVKPDVEVKSHAISLGAPIASPTASLSDRFEKFSSWYRLKKTVARIFRFRNNLLMAIQNKRKGGQLNTNQKQLPLITLDEMENAEKAILKNVQRAAFPEEFSRLESGNRECVKRNSPLFKLDPLVRDGLLRVGGRLTRAHISSDAKHQIIIPKGSHVSNLIIDHYHKLSGHSGRQHVLSMIRQKYWIIKANSAVRRVLRGCYSCRKREAPPCEQIMADLPEDRLIPDKPPFTAVGVDFFGPFQVRRSRSLVKRYGVIFTCLTIRAVHIEVAHSLDTDSFLLALRRFIARRGQVQEIRSDNGTNITSGERELRESIQAWNNEKIHEAMLQKSIKWSFNPPCGSHHGGIWERCIRSLRKILRALLQEQTTDDEGLATLMCEVESILNNRPLTVVSDDSRDLEPLTPNHLLLLKSDAPMPPGTFQREDLFSRRRWRQVQYLADVFWKRWSREYLPLLQIRQKWQYPRRNLAVGDIVLVVTENTSRNQWPLGRIQGIFSDKRGFVRKVKVSVKSTILERPVDKIVLLVEEEKSNSI